MENSGSFASISAVSIGAWLLCAAAAPIPTECVLERTVGYNISTKIARVQWETAEPPRTNLVIYAGAIPELDSELIRRVANYFALKGEIERSEEPAVGAFGYWIREQDPTNQCLSRDVAFIATTGAFRYGTSDNGYRYDPKTKAHPRLCGSNQKRGIENSTQVAASPEGREERFTSSCQWDLAGEVR